MNDYSFFSVPQLKRDPLGGCTHMRLRTIIPFAAATVLACPGVIVGGRRIIYVNGFHKTQVAETRTFLTEHRNDSAALRNFPSAFRDSDYWRGVATMVCDGGEYYFGVEYDPETHRFRNFSFNGR